MLAICRVDFCQTVFTEFGYKKNSWRDDERPAELRWETQSWVEVILVEYWINDLKFHLVITNTCTCIFLWIWSSFFLWSCHPVAWAHFYDNSSSFSFGRAKVVWLLRLAKPTKQRKDALQLFRGQWQWKKRFSNTLLYISSLSSYAYLSLELYFPFMLSDMLSKSEYFDGIVPLIFDYMNH